MGACKSRLKAKRGDCEELTESNSPNAFTLTRESCRSSDSRNHNNRNPRDTTKKHSLSDQNDYRKVPNKYGPTSATKANNKNECKCYTALTSQKYSLDALTPEEQFEEVEKVFCEKKSGRAPTQINRRSAQSNRQVSSVAARERAGNATATASVTDTTRDDAPSPAAPIRGCKPDCRCAERKTSAVEVIRRNGLQKVGHSNAGCKCVLYDGRVGRLRKEELSQAQAIAIAVREYCVQRRKRTQERRQYCMCNKDVLPKPQWQEDEELERKRQRKIEEQNMEEKDFVKVEDEMDEDEDAEEDMGEGEGEHEDEDEAERVAGAEVEEEIDERVKSRAADDETFEDEHREREEYLPETRRRLQGSEQIDPESGKRSSRDIKHDENCKCCTCRKEWDTREYADEDTFSLSDIELEVQTIVSTEQASPRHMPKKSQGRQESNESAARRSSDRQRSSDLDEQQQLSALTTDEEECECCLCSTKEIQLAHEEEVLVKKTNLAPQSPHELARDPDGEQKPGHRENEELKARRAKRRVSTNDELTHEEDCRCCDCDKATMTENLREIGTEVGLHTKRAKRESTIHENETSTRRSTESEAERERITRNRDKWEPKDAYAVAATQLKTEGQKERIEAKRKCCCRSDKDDEEEDFKPCCSCKKDETTVSRKKRSTEHITSCSAEQKSRSSRQRKESNISDGNHQRSHVRRQSGTKAEKECHTVCRCKKAKGVPLTKCCKCREELAYSAARQHNEDMERRKLAEELADRLQRRAELQIALQKRLQDQLRAKKKQRCCCDPPPCCFPQYPCCEMRPPEPMSCYEAMQSPCICCPTTPCCPPCCCEQPPCYGQECPCCCQPLKYCCPPSCAYPRIGL